MDWSSRDLKRAAELVEYIVTAAEGGAALLGPEDNAKVVTEAREIVQEAGGG